MGEQIAVVPAVRAWGASVGAGAAHLGGAVMATRFRYKPEGPEARAWLRIALRVEKGRGTYWYQGLCAGICKARVSRSVRASMRSRLQLFNNHSIYFWPLLSLDDERGKRTDRITAAWLCYWMAREEGA